VDWSGSWTAVDQSEALYVKYNMSVLTQLTFPGEARPLKIVPEAIYSSSFISFGTSTRNIKDQLN